MKVLFDTNVILDVFLQRNSFYKTSTQLIGFAEQNKIEGWICCTTVTTIHYLLTKTLNQKKAIKYTGDLLKIFHVANVNRVVLEDALSSNFKDYEDAVLCQSAVHTSLDCIVTRNESDFQKSPIPVYNPSEFLSALDILK